MRYMKSKGMTDAALIFICWLVYTIAQIGRHSYSSNTTLIIEKYEVSHVAASLPTTFFFFAYGIGQIITGIFCSKYNKRFVISGALAVSAVCNILLFLQIDFVYVKYIWLINGLAQANIWPVVVLTIGENISEEYKAKSAFWLSTASMGGTFLSYAIGSAFAIRKELFVYTFLVSGIALGCVAFLWFFSIRLPKSVVSVEKAEPGTELSKNKTSWGTVLLLGLFGELSLAGFAISGGLRQWVPSIMKEMYGLEDWMAILVTVLLPLFSIPNALISQYLYKKLNNFVLSVGIMFALAILLFVALILLIETSWVCVLFLFIALTMSMGVITNTLTVQVPLYMQDKANAGFLAGFLNGCCYVGSALSTYGLGLIADEGDWMGVFLLLLGITIISATLAFAYFYIEKAKGKKIVKSE